MRPLISATVAFIGFAMTVLLATGLIRWTSGLVRACCQIVEAPPPPDVLSAFIGEAIIALFTRGVLAILPAGALYAALVFFKSRQLWFYRCVLASCAFFAFLPPVGTLCGLLLYVAVRRRRKEFQLD